MVTPIGMMFSCKQNSTSRWTRRRYFARIRRVRQEAKKERATSGFMRALGNGIGVGPASRRLARDEEPWSRACASHWM
jgi:hypothetical protein